MNATLPSLLTWPAPALSSGLTTFATRSLPCSALTVLSIALLVVDDAVCPAARAGRSARSRSAWSGKPLPSRSVTCWEPVPGRLTLSLACEPSLPEASARPTAIASHSREHREAVAGADAPEAVEEGGHGPARGGLSERTGTLAGPSAAVKAAAERRASGRTPRRLRRRAARRRRPAPRAARRGRRPGTTCSAASGSAAAIRSAIARNFASRSPTISVDGDRAAAGARPTAAPSRRCRGRAGRRRGRRATATRRSAWAAAATAGG